MSLLFLCAEVGIGPVVGLELWVDLDTCELCLRLAQRSRTFHKALTFTTESFASPAHADGQHWEGGRHAGRR